MGLEEFTNESIDEEDVIEVNADDSKDSSDDSGLQSSVDYDISEYKEAVVGMLKETGEWPSKNYWNENKNEYGVTTWATDLENQAGVGFTNLLLLSGATPLDIHWQELDNNYIDASMYLAASVYGEDFTAMDMQNTNGLVHTDIVKRVTGDTFNERKEKLNFDKNLEVRWNREDVIEQIDNNFNHGEEISRTKLNDRCDFSESVVKRFGEGKYVKGLKNLGFSITSDQDTFSDSHSSIGETVNEEAASMYKSLDNYDPDADGYIYILELTHSSEKYYYIGSTIEINHRITRHLRQNGSTSSVIKLDGEIANSQDVNFDVQLLGISPMYINSDESKDDFGGRLLMQERLKYNEACSRGKLPTKDGVIELPHEKLLGGK